ncbi:TPA: DUF3265 domain-containing protein [Vibrio vulnificus]|nr:DUF3265 domain-containing protein [Vibrio vulnificus]HDY8062729.1 DUF3265 domain-containing protein [Vibrio vulnificus]HDY8081805.1 DUF3265 domain-containing protein [Vibrio vulnificus]HDY8192775.1 DUF3265 domain-containing protein [Vibrio vulnificus]
MTRRLSGIHAAWHFWFVMSFGGESGLRKLGLGGIHPLTRRYNHGIKCSIYDSKGMESYLP